ncbi:MAG: sulfate permease [Clostridia bacterium]|nr:sulfate permease [Clostridia bacterium]
MKKKLIPELIPALKGYNGKKFVNDLVAGIIVAIIALPLSIALALASGVGPEKGLYTAIVAGFIISALGGSRVQIAGPTAAFATIVAGIVAKQGIDGLVWATTMAGILLVLMGILRLGSLIRFVPYTITTGFTSGIAVTIFIGQIKDFLGLTFTGAPVETMEKVEEIAHSITTFNWQALAVGAVALAILIFFPKVTKKIPPSLIAVIVCALMVKLLHMDVNTIGSLYEISAAAPVPALPVFDTAKIMAVIPDAITIAMLAAVESLLSCVVADGMIGARHNSNMELVAQGAGNICSALFGGIPATGAIARTAANIKNGGRTPIAGMIHAVVLLGVLLVLMPLAQYIPMPAIAAILFMVAYNMSEWREFVSLVKKAPRTDILVLLVTFVLTVVFDLVVAICVGIVLAVILFMKRMSDATDIYPWAAADGDSALLEIPEGVMVYEITGPIFFGVATKVADAISAAKAQVVVLRMRSVPEIDATGLHSLENILSRCRRTGQKLVLSHVNEQPMKALRAAGLIEEIGEENLRPNIGDALGYASELVAK